MEKGIAAFGWSREIEKMKRHKPQRLTPCAGVGGERPHLRGGLPVALKGRSSVP